MRYCNTAECILSKHHSTCLQSQHTEEGKGENENEQLSIYSSIKQQMSTTQKLQLLLYQTIKSKNQQKYFNNVEKENPFTHLGFSHTHLGFKTVSFQVPNFETRSHITQDGLKPSSLHLLL